MVACLVEKQRTTPDQYPLTLNSLRLACNQSTNRDPVVDYDEGTIRPRSTGSGRRKWTTLASWSTPRSVKYKQVLDQALDLTPPQVSLLAVLMLRGPQTPGELRTRTERMYRFESNEELETTLRELIERELAAPLPRLPGSAGTLHAPARGRGRGAGRRGTPPCPSVRRRPGPARPGLGSGIGERVDRLEAELAALRAELRGLRERLDA